MTKRKKILVLGTSMGGGDAPPVVAVALGLLERGHDVVCIGDAMLAEATRDTKLVIEPVPKGLELAEYFMRYSKRVADSPDSPLPKHLFDAWGEDVLSRVRDRIVRFRPEVLLCGLATLPLGANVRRETKTPLCHVNSTLVAAKRLQAQDPVAAACGHIESL